ncbi:diguanylate cyclase [Sulfuricurvum kujiense DSM 16994]|uniref:Diguanylate cyclase n=1 Tax=Sulfuricurvum kujiense (strain ATCC BAA-921 / DSM 16994 / JCM 11577 / YK-1) TaxID=709032 RepID=E4U144_SULKY|nr:sensor domain-containing diguanylate cyclase [Sulfuricurvum kujiense]ADR33348.1 diguanylate cyclase [Sulfuricurvum kujiense DSM 16994]
MHVSAKLVKVKMLWTLMLVAFFPMLLIAFYSYYNIKNQIIASELAHLEAIAKLKSLQIENFYYEIKGDLHTIQFSPYTKNLILNRDINLNEAKTLFEQQLNEYIVEEEINKIFIIGLDGKILASSLKVQENHTDSFNKTAFEEGKSKIYFSDIYKSDIHRGSSTEHNNYLFTASAPILDYDNRLIGVIVAEFSADNFFNQIQDYSGLGESGETLLGKRSGDKIIFLNPLRHDPNAGMKRSASIDGKLAKPAIFGATGHNGSGVSVDYRGISVLAAWRYVPTAGWGMVAKIDQNEALRPLETIRNSILLTVVVLLVIGAVFSFLMVKNITEPIETLANEAHLDALTGLPNRKYLKELLDQVLSKAKLENSLIAVMFLDLDGFKSVNDTYGHETGDLLLKEVAFRLNSCVRQSDTVARLGGDEFIVLIPGTKEARNVETIAEKIIQVLTKEFDLDGISVTISASIGICVFPDHALDAEEMLHKADKAMYEVKNAGKGNYRFCDDSPL